MTLLRTTHSRHSKHRKWPSALQIFEFNGLELQTIETFALNSQSSNLTVGTSNLRIRRSALKIVEFHGLDSKASNLTVGTPNHLIWWSTMQIGEFNGLHDVRSAHHVHHYLLPILLFSRDYTDFLLADQRTSCHRWAWRWFSGKLKSITVRLFNSSKLSRRGNSSIIKVKL